MSLAVCSSCFDPGFTACTSKSSCVLVVFVALRRGGQHDGSCTYPGTTTDAAAAATHSACQSGSHSPQQTYLEDWERGINHMI